MSFEGLDGDLPDDEADRLSALYEEIADGEPTNEQIDAIMNGAIPAE